ncbi:polyubiquitin-like [Trematomus bernacchii]|uniref:polyubiquitin-like n=1 Tax=Trematomus bernacchii TaxID=40690 RepID=UPI00146CAC1F|nr:polyubiquitin-like [Trematomus bernacchii]
MLFPYICTTGSHVLSVRPHDTVSALKILIQQKLGFSCESQKLVFENGCSTTLNNDSATLESYGLHSGARVNLLVTTPAIIQVFLKNDKGVSSTYDIKPDETVSHFKSRVEERERVPVSQQSLVHEGKVMNEGKLSDYNVRAHSTISLNLRLRGGCGHWRFLYFILK